MNNTIIYSNRYDYILEAVEIAEELDELKKMRREDTRLSARLIEDDLDDWEGIIAFEIIPKSSRGCCLS
jgi:hypothetical protein